MGDIAEVELKLALDRTSLRLLENHPLIAPHLPMSVHQRLVSTYFDTADRALKAQDLTFRIRKAGRRFRQTVKFGESSGAGLFDRIEWEIDLPSAEPDLDRLSESPFDAKVRELIASAEIAPLFVTEVRRRVIDVTLDQGASVEIAFDRGAIVAGDRRQPLDEVELELKSGPTAALFDFARTLLETVPFRFETEAKSARGYRLADNLAPEAARARVPDLDSQQTVAQGFRAIVEECLRQIAGSESTARLGVDPEGIHQMRVGVRRLRSAFKMFREVLPTGADVIAAELKWFGNELGPARDWDVFVTELLAPLRTRRPDDKDLDKLARESRRQRTKAQARAMAAIGDSRYTALKLDLLAWLRTADWGIAGTEPIADRAARLLKRSRKRLRKLGDRHAELTVEDLHRLRIRAKEMRYAVEFFRALHPKKAVRRQLEVLAELQDTLGTLNDSAVGEKMIAEAVHGRRLAWAERARAVVDGWYAALNHAHLDKLPEAWARYGKTRRYWPEPDEPEVEPDADN